MSDLVTTTARRGGQLLTRSSGVDAIPALAHAASTGHAPAAAPVQLAVRGVSKTYSAKDGKVLDAIDLEVGRG